MSSSNNMITTLVESVTRAVPKPVQDYVPILEPYGLTFSIDEQYIHCGVPQKAQGWLLHLTVVPVQMERLLQVVVPVFMEYGLAFKIVQNRKIHASLNGGEFGEYKIGKAITCYLEDEGKALSLVDRLAELTGGFVGPRITTDFYITTILYTRYGSFVTRTITDVMGKKSRVIVDGAGNEFLDKYYNPPIVPHGIEYPFIKYAKTYQKPEKVFLIRNKYMPVRLLKSDVKGDVWKALYFNKWGLPAWCVIKQGRKGMFSDVEGRDMIDRLTWQQQLSQELTGESFTRVNDFFSDEGMAILVTEYVKGSRSLIYLLRKHLKAMAWFTQPLEVRLKAVDYLIQIISALDGMHSQHYVHRDVTGTNFLFTRKGKVKQIDLELAYSLAHNEPNPPFKLGTDGYMSPEQEMQQTPCIEDDIYSVGSLGILMLTGGHEPIIFLEPDKERMRKKLFFLSQDKDLVDLVLECHQLDPSMRPSLKEVKDRLTAFKKKWVAGLSIRDTQVEAPDVEEVRAAVQAGIGSLGSTLMAKEGVWYAEVTNEYGRDVYPLGNKHTFSNMYSGTAGIISLLWKLEDLGYDISPAADNLQKSFFFLESDLRDRMNGMHYSYCYGKAGVAVLLCEGIRHGVVECNEQTRSLVINCLQKPSRALDLIYGMTGQALAVFQCRNVLGAEVTDQLMTSYVKQLINTQQKDGSWVSVNSEGLSEKVTGFGYGIAGIVYFLLEYGAWSGKSQILEIAKRGLAYLTKNSTKKKDSYCWRDNDKTKLISSWWCQGGPGIALTYLKAFEITGQSEYRVIAEKCLRVHLRQLVYIKMGQCHGISGLGSIYLEAFRVTGQTEWKERADWIANLLLHLSKQSDTGQLYWATERHNLITGDLMMGQSGVLHFLAGYCSSGALSFPLLPRFDFHKPY